MADRVTAGFSHGMGRRLSVVLAAFHAPAVLLLDEPFDGVDPLGVDATLDLVEAERARRAPPSWSRPTWSASPPRACEDAVVLRGGQVAGGAPAAELTGAEGERRYRGDAGVTSAGAGAVSAPRSAGTPGPRAAARACRPGRGAWSRCAWRACAARRARARVVGAALLPGLAVAAVVTGALYPRERVPSLDPADPLGVAVLPRRASVVAAATGAGGRQLLPREQAVAFPVSPAADHLGAVLTAPLNLAWSVQAVTLLGAHLVDRGAGAGPGARARADARVDRVLHRRRAGRGLARRDRAHDPGRGVGGAGGDRRRGGRGAAVA